jgi:hypothetical protein
MTQRAIAAEYCRKYPSESKREIARMIFEDHPEIFKDAEAVYRSRDASFRLYLSGKIAKARSQLSGGIHFPSQSSSPVIRLK